jgi:HK97 family phage major capsid protein
MSEEKKQPESQTEERVKRIAAEIAAKVDEAKQRKEKETEPGKGFSSEEKEYIEKALKDQLALINSPEAAQERSKRESGGFKVSEEYQPETDDQGKKQTPQDVARVKMAADRKTLLRYHTPDIASKIEDFQRLNDELYIVGTLLAKKNGMPYVKAVRSTQMYSNMSERLKSDAELRKALATGTAAAGAEWIPTGFSNQLVEIVRLERKVVALFPQFNMPTNPWTSPVQLGKATGYYVPENTADEGIKIPASTPATGSSTFNAKKLAARVVFSEEINEDSIINVMDFVRMELGTAIAEAEEKVVLNGDDTATHMDSNVTSANDAQKAFKGLRKYGLLNAAASLDFSDAAPTIALMRSLRRKGGKYAVNPSDTAWVMSIQGYLQALSIAEVLTADKLPDRFTVLNGVLGSVDGSPIAVSEFVYDNLNASGVYDGATVTQTVMHYVYIPGFIIGNRTQIMLKAVEDPETGQIKLISSRRLAFEEPLDATTEEMSLLGYNIPAD